ncbi:hypothetical protein ACK3SF_03475 [Candidatus Nanosalina sp. VS9-1]|uniref:class III lanthionine synthetase LanKC N-terminal domain-containing protein n=1 Tax=Candidatus Nanosalina sp. VS9-1 TaxID=3388566 RepID=UPI0039E15755
MTSYSDAVEALASDITSTKRDLEASERFSLARVIISKQGLEVDPDSVDFGIDGLKISLTDSSADVLKDYLTEIQNARKQEIGKQLEASIRNARRLSDLRNKLERDVSKASEEDRELESIASRLQDSGLGKIAGKEEKQINELGRKIEELDRKGKKVQQLESILTDILDEHGLEKDEIETELHKRAERVSNILSKKYAPEASDDSSDGSDDTGSSLSEPWQLVAKDPTTEPDWSKNSADIWKGRWAWVHKSGGKRFNWMVHSGKTASQGWKIHVAVNPENEDEVLRVAEAVMPVLKGMESENKFGRNAESLKNKGKETAVKLATIYPKQDDSPSDNVNQNRKTTEKIVGELCNALEAEGLLSPTKIVKTIGEFNVSKDGGPTRIFVRYDKLGGDEVVDKDGNVFGARKPGAVPEGFNSRDRKDTSGHDIEILPGLKPPSFDIYLPNSNYDR